MELHFATLWEAIADRLGDREAVVCGDDRRTWTQFDERASRLAAAFGEAGLGPDAKIGHYLYNSTEYLETHFASFKARCVPINVNYRYLDDELHYLLDNSDAEALVFHSSLGERVARVMERCPKVRLWIEVDDGGPPTPGATPYDEILSAHPPAKRTNRSEDDIYMLYTGGTTGMPKGVMYNMGGMVQAFVFQGFPILGLPVPASMDDVPEMAERAWADGQALVSMPACPLMHGTGIWLGAMIPYCTGARVVALPQRSFDAHELWEAVVRERVGGIVIVGDAFARPMLTALEEARDAGRPYDLSALRLITSSGVMFSSELKAQMLEWAELMIVDAIGSTEGTMGVQVTTRGNVGETARFSMMPNTKVFTEDGRRVEPGSGEAGMVAAGGTIPIGYYKDETKSLATFRSIDGVRYSFPGDWATIDADGNLNLLGRGSNCINTAGEKVYPEEVEEAVKQHPEVQDCLVVGVDDPKFGQRVTAVASLVPGSSVDGAAIHEFVRSKLAGYKLPKQVVLVDQVRRAPNGKADYGWAREAVEKSLAT